MTTSQQNMANLLVSLNAAAAQHGETARFAESGGDIHAALLHRALSFGLRIHAAKAERLLADLPAVPASDSAPLPHDQEERNAAFHDMIMTAARERQPAMEAVLLQIMKAGMSHHLVLRKTSTPDSYQVCQICGFIAPGTPPERCPVCRVVKEQFTVFA